MIDNGKQNVLGVLVDAVDYDASVMRIRDAAIDGHGYSVSALAVHGVMSGVDDDEHRYRLNHLDLVTPDGQPVRWAVRWTGGPALPDRVYGPELTLRVCEMARDQQLPVFFYGSTADVLELLATNLTRTYPGLQIAGSEPSRFGPTSADEQLEIAARIKESGARITFAGLGCPRQEVFAYEYRDLLDMPVLAVGAAFDYHAGVLKEPPDWVQRVGMQWAYRLGQDPKRLWHRYTVLNGRYLSKVLGQRLGLVSYDPQRLPVSPSPLRYG
ncbi:MAG: WecB/TagA/CpsF family glycosyltransferase [Acidimicrobiales bacterium]